MILHTQISFLGQIENALFGYSALCIASEGTGIMVNATDTVTGEVFSIKTGDEKTYEVLLSDRWVTQHPEELRELFQNTPGL